MTVCGRVNVLLVEGTSEEPLGIEDEGGGRVRERLSLIATVESCGGLNLCETQMTKDNFHSCKDSFFDFELLAIETIERGRVRERLPPTVAEEGRSGLNS